MVYPTDTAYGLAVDATNLAAVKKLYRLKGRNFKKPIHIIAPGKYLNTVKYLSIIVSVNKYAKKLIKKFWPGPLTIVLPLKAIGKSWQMLSAGTGTLGIRLPKHELALELVRRFGKPISTTSANLSGKPDNYSISAVKKQFANSKFKPDYYLDGGRLAKCKPSTVVAVDTDRVRIIRAGPITKKQIQNTI